MDLYSKALSDDELAVVRATEPAELATLDEDGLLELHLRIRRARTKYVGQYRRQARSRVEAAGGRGKARPENRRAKDKAEIFEAALAKVSTALAKAARQSAAELKAERLTAARAAKSGGPAAAASVTAASASPADQRPPVKSGGRLKRDASDIAIGKRKQAKKDAR